MFDTELIKFNKLRLSSIIIFPLCLIMINSYTMLMRYNVVFRAIYLIGILLFTIIACKQLTFKTIEQVLWFSFLIYVTVTALVFNDKDANAFLISLWCFSLLLTVAFDAVFYERLIGIFNIIIFIFVLSMYVNMIIPNLMTGPLNFLLLDATKGTIAGEVSSGVFSGLFGEKLAAAYGSSLGFVFAYSQYLKKPKAKYLILSLFYIMAIFLTGKRTAVLIPVAVMIISIIVNKRDSRIFKRAGKYLILLLVLFIISVIFIPQVQGMLDKLFTTMFSDASDDVTSNRASLLWPMAQDMFSAHPIFGNGLSTYNSYVSSLYASDNSVLSSWSTNAHNIFLQLLAETGIIGGLLIFSLFLFLLVHTFILYRRIKDPDDKQLCLISLGMQCVFLLVGATENSFYVTGELLTYIVAFGIFIALKRKYRNVKLEKVNV
ncbi:MAG: O-antigen ligase family protein [Ruminococcus sp.]